MDYEQEAVHDSHTKHAVRERDEAKQRLSDLATAVHDWAEAHGYLTRSLDIGPFTEGDMDVLTPEKVEADRKLMAALARNSD